MDWNMKILCLFGGNRLFVLRCHRDINARNHCQRVPVVFKLQRRVRCTRMYIIQNAFEITFFRCDYNGFSR